MSKAAGRISLHLHIGRPGRDPVAILKDENGDVNYFSTVVFIFIAVLLLAFILELFSIISTKQELDHCAGQMVEQIQLSEGINGETDQFFNFLCSRIGLRTSPTPPAPPTDRLPRPAWTGPSR